MAGVTVGGATMSARRPRARTRAPRRRTQVAAAYALLAPATILVVGVLAYPIAWEIWVSLTDFSGAREGGPVFVGLANYAKLLGDAEFWRAFATTIAYLAVTTIAKLALGVALALLLTQPSRLRALVFLAVFLPWAYPGGVTVIAWFWMLNPPITTGYSVVMGNVKHAVDGLFGTGAWAFVSVLLFNVWRGSSFTAVFLLAGLNAIPIELFEYARLETTSVRQRFVAVTVPLLRPYLALAAFLSFTTAFADLGNVWMLTGGRVIFPIVGTYAYWLGIASGRFGDAAAWTLSLVPFLALGLIVLFRWFDPAEEPAS